MEALNRSIGFIGGGRVVRIILSGLSNSGFPVEGIVVYDTNPDVLHALSEKFPGIKVYSKNTEPASADLVF